MNAPRLVYSAILALTVTVVASAIQARAQTPAPAAPPAPVPGQAGRGRMGGMMAERAKIEADMAAQARKLDELVAQMNAAKGADKVDRVAAALTELVAQHNAMHRRMMAPGGMMAPPQTPSPTTAPEQNPPLPQAHDH